MTPALTAARPEEVDDTVAWVRDGIVGFAKSVLSIAPRGFEVYARIFHPALADDDSPVTWSPVTWQEIAAAAGRVAHRAMQWPSLVGTTDGNHTIPGVFRRAPETGSLPTPIAETLVEVLEPFTSTPETCWFAVWDGFGALGTQVARAPTFSLPNREYHLVAGRIEAALDNMMEPPFRGSSNLWWPADRAWCVATEIDFDTTYVGARRACIDSLLGRADLETYEVEATDGVTWASDTINPSPVEGREKI